ncbi:hypothetical protein TRAPUB_4455 [Trametes pubescens]|uniref:Uncharacterized protein n=1 Tax=Trametes pubescens TaxID=154538 RepID=A0A1M2VAW6_TRAPU|nr:hypothetical protein TRAPUB_4455 [Trametes pubescens]
MRSQRTCATRRRGRDMKMAQKQPHTAADAACSDDAQRALENQNLQKTYSPSHGGSSPVAPLERAESVKSSRSQQAIQRSHQAV